MKWSFFKGIQKLWGLVLKLSFVKDNLSFRGDSISLYGRNFIPPLVLRFFKQFFLSCFIKFYSLL